MAKERKRKCGANEEKEVCGKVYECRFCSLKFYKSQAFAGHMKGHRQAIRLRSFSQIRTRQATRKRRSSAVSSCISYTSRHRGRLKRGTITKSKKKLDTKTFESYLENLWRETSEDRRSSCAYLDSLWFASYMDGSFSTKVLTWIKEKCIFSRKYVFVPIICWNHWNLLILCNFGEALGSTDRPCMLLLDSLTTINPLRLEPVIRKFVLDVYRSEGRQENERYISRIPLLVPKVPQQSNGEECGIFVLHFIKLFLQNAPENFSISKGYPYFLKKNWFGYEDLEKFCEEICSFSLFVLNPQIMFEISLHYVLLLLLPCCRLMPFCIFQERRTSKMTEMR